MSIFSSGEFLKTESLESYAKLISQCSLVHASDSDSYCKFCSDCIVLSESSPPSNVVSDSQRGSSVRDVLNRVIEMDIRKASTAEYKDRNILSLGYRSQRWHSDLEVKDSLGIECYFVNTVHSFFMSRHWEVVLSRLGDRGLQHVMSRPVMLPVGSSHVQICGQAMPHYLRHHCINTPSNIPRSVNPKRTRRNTVFSQPLPRHCMFYNTFCCSPGLPRKHILNKRSASPADVVNDMLLCFSTLCMGGYNYQKRKKQKSGIDSEMRSRSERDHDGGGCGEGGYDSDYLTISPVQMSLLEGMTSIVLSGYRKSNISFLLDYYCPRQKPSGITAHGSSSAGRINTNVAPKFQRVDQHRPLKHKLAGEINGKRRKKTYRGRRAGKKVRMRCDFSLFPSAVRESSCSTRNSTARVKQQTHATEKKICPPPGSVLIKQSDIHPKIQSVGDRLVEKAWQNGKFDVLIAEQGLHSQEPNECSVISDIFDQVECEGSLCDSARSEEEHEREGSNHSANAFGAGVKHHIHMRSMATVASDPADWMNCSDQGSVSGAISSSTFPAPTGTKSTGKHGNQSDMHDVHDCGQSASSATEVRNLQEINNFDLSCPTHQVVEFVQAVCRQMFPRIGVWCSTRPSSTRGNVNLFMKRVREFVLLGRWESLNVTGVSNGMKCSMIPWLTSGSLHPPASTATDEDEGDFKSTNMKDSDSDHVLLSVFLAWVFTEVIPPLIASCFYVTEGEGTGGRVLFYRKQDWEELRAAGEAQMGTHFVKVAIDDEKLTSSSSLKGAYPCVRFVPKRSSMRAITNMKSMPHHSTTAFNIPSLSTTSSSVSAASSSLPHTLTNASLYNVLHVLNHLHQQYHPSACGFGVLGVEEACKRFKTFRSYNQRAPPKYDFSGCVEGARLSDSNALSNSSQQYFVAVLDLEKCFDRVDTARLYDVVAQLVKSRDSPGAVPVEHLIHKYKVSMFLPSAERLVSRSIRHVAGVDDFKSFQEASEVLAASHHSSVISDDVVYPSLSRDDLLKILRQHLFQHAVQMPERSSRIKQRSSASQLLYTQVRGIPQGSALSPLLCNLYYGHVEKDTFGSREEMDLLGLSDMSSLIVRVMDDYLMISTRKNAVAHFLQRAHTCFQPFGGGFNPSKTKVNFDIKLDVGGQQVSLPRMGAEVSWCGFSINHATLEISPSFSKLLGGGIEHSVSRDCSHSGVAFRKALKGFIRPKFQAIVLDAAVNKFGTVTKSIYSIFLMAAARTDTYLREGAKSLHPSLSPQSVTFITTCIREVIEYGATLVTLRSRQSSRNQSCLAADDRPTGGFSWHNVSTFCFQDRADGREIKSASVHAGVCCDSAEGNGPDLCSVSPHQTKWLGYQAFVSVLSRHRSVYTKVLQLLKHMKRAAQRSLSKAESHISTGYTSFLKACERDLLERND